MGFAALAVGCRGGKTESDSAEKEPAARPKGVVELTAEQFANARLALGRVEKRSHAGHLEATAQIEATPDGQAHVGPRIAGRVVAVNVTVGRAVSRGQALATIDSPDLGRAKADFIAALTSARVARETATRERALFDKKISSEREWRDAEATAVKAETDKDAAENRLHALGVPDSDLGRITSEGHYTSTIPVPAPISGVVVERAVTLGQMVQPSDILFTVMDLSEVWIVIDVYERNIGEVRNGQTVTVRVPSFPGTEFKGTVENVGPIVEAKTRTVKVRVSLPNPKGTLRPGMFATVVVEGATGVERTRVLVPASAVQRDGEQALVFVPRGEREFEARKVKLGEELGEWIEVLSGLSEGEVVVTTGAFALKAELKKGELAVEE